MSLPSRTPSDGLFRAAPELRAEAHVPSFQHYQQMYRDSLQDPAEFWGAVAKDFHWQKKHSGPFLKYNFDVTKGDIFVEWMKGATTNICYNALDRNVHERKLGDKIAFYWEGNEPGDDMKITYCELLQKVCQFANVLREQGVKKGDKVSIYMPMIIELVVAMLACARIGAIHSIVFAGFSAESLCERILDSHCSLLITAGPSSQPQPIPPEEDTMQAEVEDEAAYIILDSAEVVSIINEELFILMMSLTSTSTEPLIRRSDILDLTLMNLPLLLPKSPWCPFHIAVLAQH